MITRTSTQYVRVAMAVVGILVSGNTLLAVVETYENNSCVLASVRHFANHHLNENSK